MRVGKHAKRVAAALVAGGSMVALLTPPALAASSTQGGTATTSIRYTEDVWTTTSNGPIDVHYTNGIGVGGNNVLYLRVCKYPSNDCSDNSAIGVRTVKHLYGLGYLPKGTKFRIQYRAGSNPAPNNYWEGRFDY